MGIEDCVFSPDIDMDLRRGQVEHFRRLVEAYGVGSEESRTYAKLVDRHLLCKFETVEICYGDIEGDMRRYRWGAALTGVLGTVATAIAYVDPLPLGMVAVYWFAWTGFCLSRTRSKERAESFRLVKMFLPEIYGYDSDNEGA